MKKPALLRAFEWVFDSVLLSHGECHTTIGATTFHFCVRHGYRWFYCAIAVKQNFKSGADTQSRTGDLTLTKGALYQLSHISTYLVRYPV